VVAEEACYRGVVEEASCQLVVEAASWQPEVVVEQSGHLMREAWQEPADGLQEQAVMDGQQEVVVKDGLPEVEEASFLQEVQGACRGWGVEEVHHRFGAGDEVEGQHEERAQARQHRHRWPCR